MNNLDIIFPENPESALPTDARMNDIVNQQELRVIALKRSGHHAIIQWIYGNLDGEFLFLNHCLPGRNPFRREFILAWKEKRFVTNIPGLDVDQECSGKHHVKDCLIYNLENRELQQVATVEFQKYHDQWLGRSLHRLDLLVLRDPFNNVASQLALHFKSGRYSLDLLRASVQIWKSYAREYLGHTSYLQNKLVINYNRWFADRDYKLSLAERLGLNGIEKGVDDCARWGVGSSFDQLRMDGRASRMKVLERWRHFENNELFRELLSDPEIRVLSEQIFGELPGIAGFYLPQGTLS